ncbi:MAG: DUF3788 domain-containing protein [Candidatus Atabeyarchaeum deiterrae]
MGVSVFVDKKHQPTLGDMSRVVGSERELWEDLIQFIADDHGIQSDFGFYGKNYGWALRYRKGGKALLSMYPGRGMFTVQIIVGSAEKENAFNLTLSRKVRKVLEDAHEFREGGGLFMPIESKEDIGDVKKLLMVKLPPRKS